MPFIHYHGGDMMAPGQNVLFIFLDYAPPWRVTKLAVPTCYMALLVRSRRPAPVSATQS
jgi:hypothetical protein